MLSNPHFQIFLFLDVAQDQQACADLIAGNDRFGDFVRIGAPFTLIVMIVAVIIVPP